LALAAALCNALATIFERMGVETAPADAAMRWKLIAHVLRRPIWFLGLLSAASAFVFQAFALASGGLTLVQPLLVTELLFLVIILRVWFSRPLGWKEAVGVVSTVAGLAVFLAVSDQGGGNVVPAGGEFAFVILAAGVAVAICILVAPRRGRAWGAAWYGTASGITFALCASFIKSATILLQHGGTLLMFEHFEPYGVCVTGAAGLFLTQNAYQAGPITASQAAMLVVDPIASILIGVELFGDNLRGGKGVLGIDAVALLVMSAGLVVLCHAPLIRDTRANERLRPAVVSHEPAPGTPATSQ
jgi:drug/metabolite transporter (DMT)-like permease